MEENNDLYIREHHKREKLYKRIIINQFLGIK